MKNYKFLKGFNSITLAGTVLFSVGISSLTCTGEEIFKLNETDKAGENSITKYVYSEKDGKFVPRHYNIELRREFSGTGNLDSTAYYKYTDNGVIQGTADDYDFLYRYDSKKNSAAVEILKNSVSDSVTGNFINEEVAINNFGKTENITGAFLNNKYGIYSPESKTIISNYYTVTTNNISGDFINNTINAIVQEQGTDIEDDSKYGTIKGNFIGNGHLDANNDLFPDGAISIIKPTDLIEGNFIKNYSYHSGGAINANTSVGNIFGTFIQNSANGQEPDSYIKGQKKFYGDGGAIHILGRNDTIEGTFIQNKANQNGGAINSAGETKKIKGVFIENEAGKGGAISHGKSYFLYGVYGVTPADKKYADIITGDFFGNKAVFGGAIYNDGKYTTGQTGISTIDKITDSNFIANQRIESAYETSGGAIENFGIINEISKSNFALNKADVGGAITNDGSLGKIEDITFLNNEAIGYSNRDSKGGAILNYGNIDKISNVDFNSNHSILSDEIVNDSGIIRESGTTNTGNYNTEQNAKTFGGAIANHGKIDNISNAIFQNNYAISKYNTSQGGAIYNKGEISYINNALFLNNEAEFGGGIFNQKTKQEITQPQLPEGTHSDNYILFAETVIKNDGTKIVFYFPYEGIDVFKEAVQNGRHYIFDMTETTEEEINDYYGISVDEYIEELFADSGTTEDLEKYYNENKIETENNPQETPTETSPITHITNTSFVNNKANEGSAIYSEKDVALKAENGGLTLVSGNKKLDGSEGDAIYMKDGANLLLEAKTDGTIQIDDKISGNVPYLVYVSGDMSGKVILNNSLKNGAKVVLDGTNMVLGVRDDIFKGGDLTLKSGLIDVANGNVGNSGLVNFNLAGQVKTTADVDLRNEVMDRFTAENYSVKDSANLDVIKLNLLSDTAQSDVKILYADEAFAKNVSYSGDKFAYTPIKKYEIGYFVDDNDSRGYFGFKSLSGGGYKSFNPSVYSSPVASSAGVYSAQLGVFNYAFRHSDAFMNLNSMQRLSAINSDKYAQGAIVDSGVFSPLYTKLNEEGGWIRPYTNFESIPLSNGPKVSSISYGSLIGHDSDLHDLKRGFRGVMTGYVGYNGASQNYDGIHTTLNGGLIGLTETIYRNKFFNASTISAGGGVGSSDTFYGNDVFPYVSAGIANKTGYNFEFKDGRIIFQPSFLFAYSFVNTFDYTASSGVRIDSKPLNAFQISPGFKLIGNTKNGWQPYFSLSMIWNINDKQKTYANGISLPQVGLKPYVQYGFGIQKLFKQDKITAWGQALVTNGGINGVGLSFGLRYLFGKDSAEVKGKIQDENL